MANAAAAVDVLLLNIFANKRKRIKFHTKEVHKVISQKVLVKMENNCYGV